MTLPVNALAQEIRRHNLIQHPAVAARSSLGATALAEAILDGLTHAGWTLVPYGQPLDDPRIVAIRRAVRDEGPNPGYHRQQLARLREAWPTLAHALDEIL